MGRIVDTLSKAPFLPLALACSTLFYLPLRLRALWDPGESQLAETARAIADVKVGLLQAPSLMIWLTASTLEIFGPTPFAARFWAAAFGLGTVWLTYRFGLRWKNERVGLLAGAILATSAGFFSFTQYLTLDMGLTFWTTLTLLTGSALLAERSQIRARRLVYILALAISGGVWTQGWVALCLPPAVLCAVFLTHDRQMAHLRIPWKGAILLCGALSAPWFVAHWRQPLVLMEPQTSPFYVYLPAVLAGFFPWVFFLPKALHSWFSHRHAAMQRDPEGALLVTWVFLALLFFSLLPSRSVASILPLFPALALLVASEFDEALAGDPESLMPPWIGRGLAALTLFLCVLLWLLKIPAIRSVLGPEANRLLNQGDLAALALGFGVFVFVGVWGMRRTLPCIGGILVVQVLLLTMAASLAPEIDGYRSAQQISQTFHQRALPDDALVLYAAPPELFSSLSFYTRREIPVLGPQTDLSTLLALPRGTWGVTDPGHWQSLRQIPSPETFELKDQSGERILFQKKS